MHRSELEAPRDASAFHHRNERAKGSRPMKTTVAISSLLLAAAVATGAAAVTGPLP
jgi:hypothetical protein